MKVLHLLLVVLFVEVISVQSTDGPWAWRCDESQRDAGACKKEIKDSSDPNLMGFLKCKLTCGTYGALWPQPASTALGNVVSYFLPSNIETSIQSHPEVLSLLNEAVSLAIQSINMYNPDYDSDGFVWPNTNDSSIDTHVVQLFVTVEATTSYLDLGTNESYSLVVAEDFFGFTTVTINAQTFFGARHGLETFTQLVEFDEESASLQIITIATITDEPTYTYRGLILDTARNFISIEDIQKTIDAMSFNKLNSLHWHMTESQSYPFSLSSLPNMTNYGAYSSNKIYNKADIQGILDYARVRGVRIVPEFDAPAHVGSGWQWGETSGLGKLVVCFGKQPWGNYCSEPPCGQFNLANENVYNVLKTMYTEWISVFQPVPAFHYGGDEVNLECWNSTQEIVDWMIAQGHTTLTSEDYYFEWANFQERVRVLVEEANGNQSIPGIIWSSSLTDANVIDSSLDKSKYIIQVWTTRYDTVISTLLNKGYSIIMSNYDALYLDCGFGNWISDGNNWCSPFKSWKNVYDNSPLEIALSHVANSQNLIVGGEAALWTEQADSNNLHSRLWPRGAALGERLWNDIPNRRWREVAYRFLHNRQRLVRRGIKADGVQPEWCYQNSGECNL